MWPRSPANDAGAAVCAELEPPRCEAVQPVSNSARLAAECFASRAFFSPNQRQHIALAHIRVDDAQREPAAFIVTVAREHRESDGFAAGPYHVIGVFTQWGQWWDSVYLCDYAAQPPFRRSVNRILVRGESVHQLERVIHAGPIRVDRGRRRDEKVMISAALTLLTNAVIAYNTWKLHQVLERSREAGQPVPSDEILAHIAPIAFRHINFQGIYRFPLERYLDRLLPSLAPGQKVAAGAK